MDFESEIFKLSAKISAGLSKLHFTSLMERFGGENWKLLKIQKFSGLWAKRFLNWKNIYSTGFQKLQSTCPKEPFGFLKNVNIFNSIWQTMEKKVYILMERFSFHNILLRKTITSTKAMRYFATTNAGNFQREALLHCNFSVTTVRKLLTEQTTNGFIVKNHFLRRERWNRDLDGRNYAGNHKKIWVWKTKNYIYSNTLLHFWPVKIPI